MAAARKRNECALSLEHAVLIKSSITVCTPHGERAISPALQNRRKPEPPKRKLPNHQIAPLEFLQFRFDIRRKSVNFGCVHCFNLKLKKLWVFYTGEIMSIGCGLNPMAYRSDSRTSGSCSSNKWCASRNSAPLKLFGSG